MQYRETPPPISADQSEVARVEHTRLRRRVLYSMHAQDLEERLASAIGSVRRAAWGPLDLTSNPYLHVWTQLAALYRRAPEVVAPPGGEDVVVAMSYSGLWTLMQRMQRDTLALREMLLRIDLDADGLPVYQPVYPDMVEVVPDPMRPSQPIAVSEWRHDPDDPAEWVRYIADARVPSYRVEDRDGNDVSRRVLGSTYTGESYPETWIIDGRPRVPYVLYHAQDTGRVWDPYTGREVVEGTLQLGVLYSYYSHVIRNAAWSQKYAVGLEPAGLTLEDGGRRAEIVTDPATLLMLRVIDGFDGQPVVGQWTSAADPERVLGSIIRYEQRLVDMAIGSADVARNSSDIRSGYSLAVSREAQREAQRAYEPMFRRGDLDVIRLTAAMMGAPTSGWAIHYRAIPRDPVELQAEWEHMSALIQAGLMDLPTAYRELHPGLTQEEAVAAVEAIARTNRTVNAA